MKHRIFFKLLAIHLTLSILSLTVLYFITGYLIEQQLHNEKENELRQSAEAIKNELNQMPDELTNGNIRKQLRTFERLNHIQITVIKNEKNTKKLIESGLPQSVSEQIKSILDGQTLIFSGTLESGGQNLLVYGFPFKPRGDNTIAILESVPFADLDILYAALTRNLLFAFGLIALLVTVAIFFVSKQMVNRIHRISTAAEKMAHGQFQERVPVVGTDEIAQLALAFNQMAGQLFQIEKHRTHFISEVAHELRTPLTTLLATLRGFIDGTIEDHEKHEFLDIAFSETTRLGRLVNDLLDLVHFEEKEITFKKVPLHLNALIEEAIQLLNHQAIQHQMRIYTILESNDTFQGDPDRIKQLLINLISNAIEHNEPGTIVTVSLHKMGNLIQLSVSDTGAGIPEEKLHRLFDRFHKSDVSRSRGGSGLGLTICKSIVEFMGGTISVTSTSSGTTFFITLP